MPIQWTPDLATGIDLIDEQHRGLYAAVAQLHEAMRSGRVGDLSATVDFLERYAVEHFAAEEATMEEAAYPGLTEHRAEHAAFVTAFLAHKARLAPVPSVSAVVELSQWLGSWLKDHVRRTDGAMARHLRAVRRPGAR